ncbi:hypothetical protein RPIT_10000 [Tessaracoccus flavus]|uniref:SpaA-like prealbumin fold domain-containing protein n=1 Tax=Tessaracoccus flavus TaxID=1610493 RepID=A0A1Q2CG92_9ACTN|nr:hypothetical protein RPIT_10000 [Tessaracoccus flavus]
MTYTSPRRAGGRRWREALASVAALALVLSGITQSALADDEAPEPTEVVVAADVGDVAATPADEPPAEAPPAEPEAPDTAPPAEEASPPPPGPAAAPEVDVVDPPAAAEPEPIQAAPQPLAAEEPAVQLLAEPLVEEPVEELFIGALMVVGGFEIEGNWVVDTPGNLDWAVVDYDVYNDGFNDTTQIGGKENEPGTWYQEGPNASGKADIGRVWSYSNITGGDQYLHMALDRAAGTGSVAYVIELNQSPEMDGLVPVRTIGDLRLNVEQGGNRAFELLSVSRWDGTAWVDYTPPAGSVYGESNPDEVTGPGGEIFEPRTFLESSFNLTQLGVPTTCDATSFSQANIRTRTSQSLSSEIEDWVRAPINVPSRCALIEIHKTDEAANALVGATFTVTPNPVTGAGTLTVTDGGTGDRDGVANGTIELRTDFFGILYTVTEIAAPLGYLLPADRSQTFTAQPFESYELTFEDPKIWMAPTISKTVTATYGAEYVWSVDKLVNGEDDISVVIAEGESYTADYEVIATLVERRTSNYVLEGEISLTNPNAAAMVVTLTDQLVGGADCTIDAVDADPATAGLQVSLPAGDSTYDYTCYDAATAPTALSGTNQATYSFSNARYPSLQAHVDSPATAGTTSDSATADYAFTESQSINKTVTVVDDFTSPDNPPVVLGTVTADDAGGPVTAVPQPPSTVVVDGSTATFDAGSATWRPEPGTCETYTNTAIVQLDVGDDPTDDASVRVCVASDLTITKTADMMFERDFDWSVTKTGSDTQLVGTNPDGSVTAEVDYAVGVALEGFTDSGVMLGGDIVVSNPNNFVDVVATVHDTTTLGNQSIDCTVDGPDYDPVADGFQVLVPRSGMVELTYSCTGVEPQPTYSGYNVATVTWAMDTYNTPSATASTGNVPVSVADAELTDETFEVSDSLAGVLGTVSVTPDGATVSATAVDGVTVAVDGSTVTYSYSDSLTGAAGECVVTTNTVTIPDDRDSHDISVCSPSVTKTATATYTRTHAWDIEKSVDQTSITIADDGTAVFTYTVVATTTGYVDSDFVVEGEITVTNPSDLTLTGTLLDSMPGASCSVPGGNSVEVAPGETETLSYRCTLPGYVLTDVDPTNTARLSWGDESVTGTALADWTMDTEINGTVDVVDDKTDPANPVTLGSVSADEGEATFTYQVRKDGVAGECTEYTNTAWVDVEGDNPTDEQTVEVCVSLPLDITKDAFLTYTRTFDWTVDKTGAGTQVVGVDEDGTVAADVSYAVTVTPTGYTDTEVQLQGEIELTNPNAFTDIVATVSDTVTVDGVASTCTVAGDEDPQLAGVQVTVPADDSVTLTYTCPDVAPGDYVGTNSATAVWGTGVAGPLSGTASTGDVEVEVTDAPVTVDQTITVYDSNVEGGMLGTVSVNRSGGGVGVMPADGISAVVNDDNTVTFTYSLTLDGVAGECVSYDNTASVPGDEDDHTVLVCSPTVTKTVDATFDRTYHWSIDKSVDQTSVTIAEDGTAVFAYTVEVAATGYTDHDFDLTGDITIANPADVPITVDVTDEVGIPGAVCTVAGGEDLVIGADDTVTVDYSCVMPTGYLLPDGDPENTVMVTWGDEAIEYTATVDWTLDERTDAAVTVVDDKTDPANPVELAELVVNVEGVIQPGEGYEIVDGSAVFAYELSKLGVAGECTDYTNTAVVEVEAGDNPSDDVTVEVCREIALDIDKTVTGSYDETHTWSIVKNVDTDSVEIIDGGSTTVTYDVTLTHEGSDESNFDVSGTITLTNSNAWPKDYSVADVFADHDCVVDDAEGTIGAAVDGVPTTLVLAYTCEVDDDFEPSDADANAAAVTFDYAGAEVTVDTDLMDVDWAVTQIDNPVTVRDDFGGESTVLGEVFMDPDGTLSLDEDSDGVIEGHTVTFTYETDLTVDPGECATFDNTVSVIGDDDMVLGDDDAMVAVCSEDDLVTVKTAAGSLDRTYAWAIDKSVVDNVEKVLPGQKVTFPYTVTVTPKGYADSNYSLAGSITVTNPNGYKAVSAEVVDEAGDDAWTCQVTGSPVELEETSSVTLSYTCALQAGATPALSGTNEVVVTWETLDGTVKTTSHEVNYQLTIREANKVVTVTDQMVSDSAPAKTLGTATWNAEGAPTAWTYTVERIAPKYTGWHVLDNVAMIVETKQSDKARADYFVAPGKPSTGGDGVVPFAGLPLGPSTGIPIATLLAVLGSWLYMRRRETL